MELELSGNEGRSRNAGVEADHVTQRRSLIIQMGELPDHPGLHREDQKGVEPAALGDCRRQEHLAGRRLDDPHRFEVELMDRLLDVCLVVQFLDLMTRVEPEPPTEPVQMSLVFGAVTAGRRRERPWQPEHHDYGHGQKKPVDCDQTHEHSRPRRWMNR